MYAGELSFTSALDCGYKCDRVSRIFSNDNPKPKE
jgi:hypothetical protein